ncbi:hypothetical protein DEM34_18210 [Spiribacter halobius]|uniref:HTH-like domain-containing protein n=1 Tax=Sediminicurvatus halobius TaxID=2182432 RepID=A0A2U2MW62_9GAMM|nr:hypothetical protein DEM34_18210 [Spiribacter halobius]
MVAFIHRHRIVHGVESICALLPIAPSAYYEHKPRETDPAWLPARANRDAWLNAEVRRVWEANFRVYDVRKLYRQRHREGIAVACRRVAQGRFRNSVATIFQRERGGPPVIP